MQKKHLIALTLASLLLSGASMAQASTAGPVNGTAQAVIIAPLVLTHVAASSLNFGTILNGQAGTVTVAAKDGSVTSTGVAELLGTTTADQFLVVGAAGTSFTVTVPANSTVTISDGASHTMAVNNFTSFCGTGGTSSCVASLAGTTIGVGGTLTVTAAQAAGAYTGTYPLSITY